MRAAMIMSIVDENGALVEERRGIGGKRKKDAGFREPVTESPILCVHTCTVPCAGLCNAQRRAQAHIAYLRFSTSCRDSHAA
jgi:hypothetical protein